MARKPVAFAAALALSLCAGVALAQRPGETPSFGRTGNSDAPQTSATGESGTQGAVGTSRGGVGATPMDQSNSASARGNPAMSGTATSRGGPGATPSDDSRSASARGGYGTGRTARTQRYYRERAARRGPAAGRNPVNDVNRAYLGGGGVFEVAPDGSLRQVN